MTDNPLHGTDDPELLQIGHGTGTDTIFGGGGRDTIFGHAADDSLSGDGGNDRIWGGDGNDRVDGLDGDDRLYGGRGNDVADAGWGNDTFYGGSGDDWCSTGYGSDLAYGGDGSDVFWTANLIVLGSDSLYGGADDDVAYFMDLASGHFDGGEGADTLLLYWQQIGGDYHRRAYIDLGAPDHTARAISDHGADDLEVTFADIEVVSVQTGFGDDTVIGAGGDDSIFVGLGRNVVDAGGGDDWVRYFTSGANTLEGGAGTDRLSVGNLGHLALTFDASGAKASDGHGSVLSGFESYEVEGGAFADLVTLGSGDDRFAGGHGDDTAQGGEGADRLAGERGDDSLSGGDSGDVVEGGRDSDTINGDAGNDKLLGGRDGDWLYGGTGRDTLNGGSGSDVLYGGAEADAFRFSASLEDPTDVVGDYVSGLDRLAFAAQVLPGRPDKAHMTAGDLSFGAVSGTAPQFLYVIDGDRGLLFWDGDGVDDIHHPALLVVLQGAPTLTGSDIWII